MCSTSWNINTLLLSCNYLYLKSFSFFVEMQHLKNCSETNKLCKACLKDRLWAELKVKMHIQNCLQPSDSHPSPQPSIALAQCTAHLVNTSTNIFHRYVLGFLPEKKKMCHSFYSEGHFPSRRQIQVQVRFLLKRHR